ACIADSPLSPAISEDGAFNAHVREMLIAYATGVGNAIKAPADELNAAPSFIQSQEWIALVDEQRAAGRRLYLEGSVLHCSDGRGIDLVCPLGVDVVGGSVERLTATVRQWLASTVRGRLPPPIATPTSDPGSAIVELSSGASSGNSASD